MNEFNLRFAMTSVVAVIGFVAIVTAQEFQMTRSTIDGGGIMRSDGGAFELSGTIGQPDAGVMSGGAFELTGGFWFGESPADCNRDGIVNGDDYNELEACLAGPAAGVSSGCVCFDLNQTDTVDLRDFAVAQTTYTG